jgi:hypothetical protein
MTITPSSTRPGSGRIYKERIHGDPKWLRFLQTVPARPPNQGIADTLDEAKAALANALRAGEATIAASGTAPCSASSEHFFDKTFH